MLPISPSASSVLAIFKKTVNAHLSHMYIDDEIKLKSICWSIHSTNAFSRNHGALCFNVHICPCTWLNEGNRKIISLKEQRNAASAN